MLLQMQCKGDQRTLDKNEEIKMAKMLKEDRKLITDCQYLTDVFFFWRV